MQQPNSESGRTKLPKTPHKHLIDKVISIDSFRLPKYTNRIPLESDMNDASSYSTN